MPAPSRSIAARAPARRSQRERSEATRAALLGAAVDVVAESGLTRATAARICERAGLSRGAHLHHFRTRDKLISAALEHLGEQLVARYSRADLDEPHIADHGRGLDVLLSLYTGQLFAVALDAISAARTDAHFATQMAPIEDVFDEQSMLLCSSLFPDLADHVEFHDLMTLVLAAVRGVAVLDLANARSQRRDRRWATVRRQLLVVLAATGSD